MIELYHRETVTAIASRMWRLVALVKDDKRKLEELPESAQAWYRNEAKDIIDYVRQEKT